MSEQVIALSDDTYTPALGASFFNTPDIQFGPDGTGYLITRGAQFGDFRILGFDAAGDTVVTLQGTNLVRRDNNAFDTAPLVFAPDGTAYATVNGPGDAGVYALTPSGAVKVLDVDYTSSLRLYTVVVADDGTAYLTTADRNGDGPYVTTVRVLTPPTVV